MSRTIKDKLLLAAQVPCPDGMLSRVDVCAEALTRVENLERALHWLATCSGEEYVDALTHARAVLKQDQDGVINHA